MIQGLPSDVNQYTAKGMFFGKYPVKVELRRSERTQNSPRYNSNGGYTQGYMQFRVFASNMIDLAKSIASNVRKRKEGNCVSFFFSTIDEATNFVNQVRTTKSGAPSHIDINVYHLTEEQQEQLKVDAKIVFKKQPYFNKYSWRMELNWKEDLAPVLEHLMQDVPEDKVKHKPRKSIYSQEVYTTDKFRLRAGSRWANSVLYLADEDDVVLARMMLQSVIKIEKVVVTPV